MVKEECVGCGACYNSCPNESIRMKRDFDGCDYPYVNRKTCIHCGKCKKVCPVLQKKRLQQETQAVTVYAGHCTDENIRNVSSSGGIFPLAAQWCIDKGGVVFGAKYENNKVVHGRAECAEEIWQFQGSKYVQGSMGTAYIQAEQALKEDRYVLFTGLPCQIEGLKAYLGREYDKLYTIDLICHGVGAPGIWEKYLKVFHHGKRIKSINFKNKDAGWNHEQLVIRYDNGQEYRRFPLDDHYDYGFNENVFLRSSCYACKFKGINRRSDLTIGDAWGVERYAPRFRDDKGCSLIFVQSVKGQELFGEIKESMKYQAVDGNKAVHFNQRMISSVPDTPKRKAFYEHLKKFSFRFSMKLMKRGV